METIFDDKIIYKNLGSLFNIIDELLKTFIKPVDNEKIIITTYGLVREYTPVENIDLKKLLSLIVLNLKSPETKRLVEVLFELIKNLVIGDKGEFTRIFGLFGESIVAILETKQSKELLLELFEVIRNSVDSYQKKKRKSISKEDKNIDFEQIKNLLFPYLISFFSILH